MVSDFQAAMELCQEVFLKVYQALDRYDSRYKFSTWIFRVAQNAAIDQIRKRRLKLVSLSRPDDLDGDGHDWELPSQDRDPYGELRFEGRRLPSLKSLDENDRVIHLRSLSKTFVPGMRLGWACGRRGAIRKMVVAKQYINSRKPSVEPY